MKVIYKKSKIHDRGVFAVSDFNKDEIIEVCPVIVLSNKDTVKIDSTYLYNYYFSWQNNQSAIALGLGSIYNHSYEPNAIYKKDFLKNEIKIIAINAIKKGEEITLNYNGDPKNQEKVWFETKSDMI